MQSLLRPRGPTLNFALDKSQVKSALETAPLMSSLTYSKPAESHSTHPAALPEPLPMNLPTMAPKLVEVALGTIVREAPLAIEFRKENETPVKEFGTPPDRVSTVVTESPAASVERVMTRKEALKVIAANKPKAAKAEPKSPEEKLPKKRPGSPETITKPPQEKVIHLHSPSERTFFLLDRCAQILKELPYGTDEVDDDLEAMLASFRDVPA